MAAEIAVACRNGDLEKVKDLVEQQRLNPNVCKDTQYGKTPIHWASHYGHLEVMKYLVENCKCDPKCEDDKWRNTPLHWAARFATLEAVKYLVSDCGCDVMCTNKQKNTPLHDAALGGNLEVVKFLIEESKCHPEVAGRWGRTPLHYACEVSSIDVVNFLLEESGYDEASCRDDTGITPLHVAASQGSLRIVKYLIEEQNCEMESKDHHNETPLHEAIKGGRLDVMKYLIKKGCDPKRGGKSGGTALHHACQHGRIEEVKYLIAKDNLAIDSPCDNSGASPLHIAAVNGRLDVVKLLVETFLCKLDIQDSNGQTALELAQDKEEEEIVSYFLELGEDSGNLRSTLLKQLRPNTKQVIPTGTVLGSGAYGSVIELTCEGKIVAGKIFRTMSTAHTITVQKKIKDELSIMMEIDHPNIVQTMGVCFLSDEPLPVLLMERMECNLHSYILDPSHFSSLSIQTKLSILCDIASGLACLHNHEPPIIHRDLTANNVLLDLRQRAKIADFGNSQISQTLMILGTLTSFPPSLEYVPKEDCSPSLDVFQFGDLALFTTIQTPVRPLPPPTYTDERTGLLCARSEIERRQPFVEKAEQLLSSNHSLVELIKQCLHNNPKERPRTRKLLKTLQQLAPPGGKVCPSQASSPSTPAANDTHYQEVKSEPKVDLALGVDSRNDADYLRGFEIFAATSFVVPDSQGHSFTWQGYGLKLHIPEGAVNTECRVDIKAGFTGQFNIPDELHLVSCVYWLSCPQKFQKRVTLEIEHCASLQDILQSSNLRFVVGKCSQAELPYQFRVLEKGTFVPWSSYGSIEVSQFSILAIAIFNKFLPFQRYRISLHYIPIPKDVNKWDIDFVITSYLQASKKAIEERYSSLNAISGPDFEVQFANEMISLEIPEDGICLDNGWAIRPLVPPVIAKQQVDRFKPGQWIPYCRLQVELDKEKKPVELKHKVRLLGTKKPFDFFTITCPPEEYAERSSAVILGKRRQLEDEQHGILKKKHLGGDSGAKVSEKREVSPHPSPVVLGTDNLYDIYREVLPVASKWKNIGLALRLTPDSLDTIGTKENVTDRLSEVLNQWLKKTYNVKLFGEPSWKLLVKAVSDSAGGNDRALAEKIAQRHQVSLDEIWEKQPSSLSIV